ncbi:hypothetical protein GCM10009690_11200 [Brevibacterium permense]|uniref:Uncharacterized protein n=1 Tax=Brevibacterium permense TaxID=234834 RepID=A0ABN2A548_9MICO
MDKIDFKRSLPSFCAKQGRFDLIEVPESQYLMIDGPGDSNTSPDFASALTGLYPLAYGCRRCCSPVLPGTQPRPETQPPLVQPPDTGAVVLGPGPPSESESEDEDPIDEESEVGDEPVDDDSEDRKMTATRMPATVRMPRATKEKTTMRQVIRGGRLLRRTILTMVQA